VPVHVNVVPGDHAAGRIPDPAVRSELAFQQAQLAKRRAGEALRSGDLKRARGLHADAGAALDTASAAAPADLRDELAGEAGLLREMADRVAWDDPSRLSKFGEADRAFKSRKRGRRPPTRR
jgi:Ca-activated chloride channel family protein